MGSGLVIFDVVYTTGPRDKKFGVGTTVRGQIQIDGSHQGRHQESGVEEVR